MESNEKVYILRKNVNIRINNLRGSFFSPPSLCSACLSVNCLRLWQHTDRHEHLHQETPGQMFFFFFSFPIRYRFLSHLIIIIQIASRLGCVRFRSIEFSCFGLTILLFRAEALRDSKRQMTNATRGSVVFQSIS